MSSRQTRRGKDQDINDHHHFGENTALLFEFEVGTSLKSSDGIKIITHRVSKKEMTSIDLVRRYSAHFITTTQSFALRYGALASGYQPLNMILN